MNSIKNDKACYYYALKGLQESFIDSIKTTLKQEVNKYA